MSRRRSIKCFICGLIT